MIFFDITLALALVFLLGYLFGNFQMKKKIEADKEEIDKEETVAGQGFTIKKETTAKYEDLPLEAKKEFDKVFVEVDKVFGELSGAMARASQGMSNIGNQISKVFKDEIKKKEKKP